MERKNLSFLFCFLFLLHLLNVRSLLLPTKQCNSAFFCTHTQSDAVTLSVTGVSVVVLTVLVTVTTISLMRK